MATNLSSWESELLLEIQVEVPDSTIVAAARDACIRFCEETHLYTSTLDAITVEADESDYTLSVPDNSQLISVPKNGVLYKEDGEDNDQYSQLDCISEELTNQDYKYGWKYGEAPNPSEFWVDNQDKQLHLVPIPTDASEDGLLVTVILKPEITTTTIPDFLYDDYMRTITSGALAYLYKMKSMPWYDIDQYAFHEGKFLNACGDAKITKLTGATDIPLKLTIPYFA